MWSRSQKSLMILTSGIKGQNYLGQPWIPLLLKMTPRRSRRNVALKILAISPHYFIYQQGDRYPSSSSRLEILESEHQRNLASRKRICESILLGRPDRAQRYWTTAAAPDTLPEPSRRM